jgi:hypothetical protein
MTSPTTINKIMTTLKHKANESLITEEVHDTYQDNRLQRPNIVIALTERALRNAGLPLRDPSDQSSVRRTVMGAILLNLEVELDASEAALRTEIQRFGPTRPVPKRPRASIPGAHLAA